MSFGCLFFQDLIPLTWIDSDAMPEVFDNINMLAVISCFVAVV